ncbi:MAG TPA: HAD family phosphatase [Anaerolineales bacterium]|nr:HAD family phosphatase [Anaerolineales bacterium]
MTIRAVIYDLGGVIIRTHDHEPRARWERRLGLSPHALERLVFWGEAGEKAALGQIDPDGVWTWVIERLELNPSDRPMLEADFWAGDRVDNELIDYMRGLRPALKTVLLSNAWTSLRTALEMRWGIADAFDLVVISAEVGLVKPDPRIFHLALSQLGVSPDEAVFLDDMQENVDAAQFVGVHGVLFENTEQAIADIASIIDAQLAGA